MSRDCCVALPRGATGLSAVCDCGISWPYLLTIFIWDNQNGFQDSKMFISHSSVKIYVVGHQISRQICDGCSEHTEHVFRSVVKKKIMLLEFWNCDMHARIQRGGGQGVQTLPPNRLKNHKI